MGKIITLKAFIKYRNDSILKDYNRLNKKRIRPGDIIKEIMDKYEIERRSSVYRLLNEIRGSK